MFNIERELELVGAPSTYKIGTEPVRIGSDGKIVVQIVRADTGRYYDHWYFDAQTGVWPDHMQADNGAWRLREKSEMKPTNHWYLHAGRRDWDKTSWSKLEHEHFLAGAEAATQMKDHNARASQSDSPYRFIVKKEVELSPIRDYDKWAAERFENGEWQKVPWADEPWASTIAYHYAHVSKADDSKVAFWASEGDAQNDTVTVMSPGRYLQQYFASHLNETNIRDWAVKLDVEAELKIVTTPDEIGEMYQKGPDSCMSYPDDNWRYIDRKNPTRVYGAGDLGLAYLERKGKIIARALVWPERKAVGRIYGDIERMTDRLKADGWEFDCEQHNIDGRGRGLLNGARLLKIRPSLYPRNFVMPYLDFGYGVIVTGEEDEFLRLDRSGSYGRQTCGLLYEANRDPDDIDEDEDECECDDCRRNRGELRCDSCGDWEDSDDTCNVEGDTLCDSCYSDSATVCERCDEYTYDHNTVDVEGMTWCTHCASAHATSCDYCANYARSPNTVLDGRYDQGEIPEPFNDACDYCIEHSEQIVEDVNGHLVDRCTVQQCQSCDGYFDDRAPEDECPSQACVSAREAELEPAE